jgi:hypothetical protein
MRASDCVHDYIYDIGLFAITKVTALRAKEELSRTSMEWKIARFAQQVTF